MDVDAGNARRGPFWWDNSKFADVDLQLPLRYPDRNIGNLVQNPFLESKYQGYKYNFVSDLHMFGSRMVEQHPDLF